MDEVSGETTDLAADYAALKHDVGVVALRRDAVRVAGPDAMTFLQGQLSQNVDIAADSAVWSLLLNPQGKMVSLVRVLRPGTETFLLDFDGGWSEAVIERLMRFKLRVKAELTAVDGWKCFAVRGPNWADHAPDALPVGWPGVDGADIVGEGAAAPIGVRTCGRDAYEALRIEAGVPVMGAELDENTIPEEAGVVGPSVSFTKGCYTGQELVARIDSRGSNVPRRLRGVVVEAGAAPPAGAVVTVDGAEVGRLTSVAFSPDRGVTIALAYIRRKVEPPAPVGLSWDGGSASAEVTTLPIAATAQV